jgi:hypothetical protein
MPRFQDVDEKWFTKPTANETPIGISHPWLTVNHPDDDRSSQLKMLKAKLRRHKIPDHTPIFLDYLCIPQRQTPPFDLMPDYDERDRVPSVKEAFKAGLAQMKIIYSKCLVIIIECVPPQSKNSLPCTHIRGTNA